MKVSALQKSKPFGLAPLMLFFLNTALQSVLAQIPPDTTALSKMAEKHIHPRPEHVTPHRHDPDNSNSISCDAVERVILG